MITVKNFIATKSNDDFYSEFMVCGSSIEEVIRLLNKTECNESDVYDGRIEDNVIKFKLIDTDEDFAKYISRELPNVPVYGVCSEGYICVAMNGEEYDNWWIEFGCFEYDAGDDEWSIDGTIGDCTTKGILIFDGGGENGLCTDSDAKYFLDLKMKHSIWND